MKIWPYIIHSVPEFVSAVRFRQIPLYYNLFKRVSHIFLRFIEIFIWKFDRISFIPFQSLCPLSVLDRFHCIITYLNVSHIFLRFIEIFIWEFVRKSCIPFQSLCPLFALDRFHCIITYLNVCHTNFYQSGTSTFDGMAIAYATLKYFSDECGSLTLFVSHYPSIFKEYENHSTCSNYHMSFIAHACDQEEQVEEHHKKSIVFLYKVVEGIAGGSYGLNVARLAGIDCAVIGNASRNSKRFADNVKAIKLVTVFGCTHCCFSFYIYNLRLKKVEHSKAIH